MVEVIEIKPTVAIDAVEHIVTEEVADLFNQFEPDNLIRFWGGRSSMPALVLQAQFASERIFHAMAKEVADELGVSQLSIQGLNKMRKIYGEEEIRELDAYYGLSWGTQLGREIDQERINKLKRDAVTARLGKKATSRALAIYQYGI